MELFFAGARCPHSLGQEADDPTGGETGEHDLQVMRPAFGGIHCRHRRCEKQSEERKLATTPNPARSRIARRNPRLSQGKDAESEEAQEKANCSVALYAYRVEVAQDLYVQPGD